VDFGLKFIFLFSFEGAGKLVLASSLQLPASRFPGDYGEGEPPQGPGRPKAEAPGWQEPRPFPWERVADHKS